jgi:uncharacterized protein
MVSDQRLTEFNPWWGRRDWVADDPHLRRLAEQPIRLPAVEVEAFDLAQPAIHVLRGPRQVGKSTDLKLLAQRALAEGFEPGQIAYLALDLLEGQSLASVADTIAHTQELAPQATAPRLLLLDEVTAVGHWQAVVKSLWDTGRIDRDIVVCTGSSAADLARGGVERLPGRRGAGTDSLVLPQSFGGFAGVLDANLPPAPGLSVAELLSEDGRALLHDTRVHLTALQDALTRYLTFGGLPAAVAEAKTGLTAPSERVRRVLRDSLLREVNRRGASEPAAQALLERVMRSLGSKTSWRRLAQEMDVPLGRKVTKSGTTDPRTLRDYVELLAVGYFALILYFWRQDSGTGDLRKDKKIYFGDPLLHTIVADRAAGLTLDRHAQVENALALALYRRYEPPERAAENFAAPERLHVWGTRRGGEVDFVCGPRADIEAVEVADWNRLSRQKATGPMRALPGRPSIVVSRDELRFSETANIIPAALALWALS